MRIYCSAAHSVGKSSLSHYIAQKYNLPIITEVARKVLSDNEWSIESLRSDIQKVNKYQKEIFYRQLAEENKLSGKSFVSDRGFDFMAYTMQHSLITSEILSDPKWNEYIESLKRPDVLILFIRPQKSLLKEDGIRETPVWDGVVAIDAMIKFMLQMFGLRYFEINSSSMQERINFVDNLIPLFLNQKN